MILYKSHYASPWKGVALCRHGNTDCYWLLILFDKNGTPMRRRVIRLLHPAWLERVGTVDETKFNPDWFKLVGSDRQNTLEEV